MPCITASEEQTMLFERLRLETRDLHQKMERQISVFFSGFTLASYQELLERYEGFYAPVEDKLIALRSRGLAIFDETRRKHSLLRLDLERLRVDRNRIRQIPRCQVLPELASVSQGMGCMYVLEGSTLGGQIILRHLKEALGVTAETGGAFFASYGAELGRRWKEFRDAVSADGRAQTEADHIVAAARDTFSCFHQWLSAGPCL